MSFATPDEIYRESYRLIKKETDVSGIPPALQPVVLRMVHACGMTDIVADFAFSRPSLAARMRRTLRDGVSILADSEMTKTGIQHHRLPASAAVRCFISDKAVRAQAEREQTTRAVAAVEAWRPFLEQAIVVIGTAPSALFHLLHLLECDANMPQPCLIIGCPVGFVGAKESKERLTSAGAEAGFDWIALHGRRGGSALAASALNGLLEAPDSFSESC